MSLIILLIIVVGFILISTENVTNVNKAAVAIFVGTVGWVLYVSYGTDFVQLMHKQAYTDFLDGGVHTSQAVKQFIAQTIFLRYVGKACEIVLFLLATMTIVEILNNNGCFDFLGIWARTRDSKKLLWMMMLIVFVVSANLDNLTTTVMALTLIHQVISNRRYRMIYGSVAVIAANMGGALTVIGSPEGLVLWNMGAITASNYSLSMALPCIVACVVPTWLLSRALPDRIDIEFLRLPYRGDDTKLNVWQRLVMFVVGIGGLWFIPTFHNITKLSPFLGALCVLSVLWVVNEIFNRKLLTTDETIHRRIPRVLQYGSMQMILFVLGIMLAVGVVNETGFFRQVTAYIDSQTPNIWLFGVVSGAISTVLDSFVTTMSAVSLHPVLSSDNAELTSYSANFAQNGAYWKMIAFATAVGGNILPIGSISGLALIRTERMRVGWYFAHVGWKVLLGGLLGMVLLWFIA
mgnify:FL=1